MILMMSGDKQSGARARRLWRITDLAWLLAFAVAFGALLWRTNSAASLGGDGNLLQMMEGAQRLGLYMGSRRLGTLHNAVARQAKGWRVSTRFQVGETEAVSTILSLHPDLSLATLRVDADLSRLLSMGGVAAFLLRALDGVGLIHVSGRCALETGVCQVRGTVAGKAVNLPVTAGRGPVLTSAIYPLLARGSLGKEAELGIFDPLTLGRRILTFRVLGAERIKLRSGVTVEGVKIQRDLEGVASHVWVDLRGRVLREVMPIGISMEHEAFLPLSDTHFPAPARIHEERK